MQKLLIKGKKKLSGIISISGSKNASLPILAACILAKDVKLENVPLVKDIFTMIDLLKFIGIIVKIKKKEKAIELKNKKKKINTLAPYKLVKTMRAGVLVLGPLLTKFKKAKVSLPGGCAIGSRPVDLHLFALKKLGAKIKIKNGYIIAEAKNGLLGSKIKFPSISVGATENALLAACGAKGKTILYNCAIEPEIIDLINFLNKLGYKIKKIGRKIIITESKLIKQNTKHKIIFDRIEAGTYLIAGALNSKKIVIKNINPKVINSEIVILKKMGVNLITGKNSVTIIRSNKLNKINITTKPYPGFPTDLQAQLMVLTTQANGLSKIKEDIFENRFMHVPELKRMGAKIQIKNKTAYIIGPTKLNGAEVMATDLRASVSLVLAGLIADNRTIVNRTYHLDRGYEFLEKKLKKCNAKIKRI
tara:strand:+ start:355 stop:1611 length:1257 start_codon:yes stop_codon:yes gene_type:complete